MTFRLPTLTWAAERSVDDFVRHDDFTYFPTHAVVVHGWVYGRVVGVTSGLSHRHTAGPCQCQIQCQSDAVIVVKPGVGHGTYSAITRAS